MHLRTYHDFKTIIAYYTVLQNSAYYDLVIINQNYASLIQHFLTSLIN